ncbi:MAG: hypothetical protein ACOC00_00080 [Halothiobacillaceae bacterium]
MESNELIAKHDIPRPLEVVPAEMVRTMEGLLADSDGLEVTDADTMERANTLVMSIHQVSKAVEAHRKKLKKPVTDLGRLIDQIAKKATGPLDDAKKRLQNGLMSYQREQQRIADEARRKAEEEQRRAEEEARKAAEEARRKQEEEDAELAALLGAPVERKEPDPPSPAPAPKPAPYIPEPPKATALQTRMVTVMEIHDEAAVPAYVGMEEVRPINKAALRRLLDAGVTVPGARLVQEERVAMARGGAS